jgi:hypothetical protein
MMLNILKAALRDAGPLFGVVLAWVTPTLYPSPQGGGGLQHRAFFFNPCAMLKDQKTNDNVKASLSLERRDIGWGYNSFKYQGLSQAPNHSHSRHLCGNPNFHGKQHCLRKQVWVPAQEAGMTNDYKTAGTKN